jgi:formamidopyrimidine-DNA glycosylase
MPELPEVETMCRGIHSIQGRKIKRVFTPPCRYRPIQIRPSIRTIGKRLAGARIERISRLGKRVLIHANNSHALILQPKMTGLVSLDSPPDPDHVRLAIEFQGSSSSLLQFWDRRGLGTVELLAESEIQSRIIDGRLGPDALSIELSDFSERLRGTKRPIKVALLDQKLVAGVGNLYASEMLHEAKISPLQPSNEISTRRLQLLYNAMQRILTTAIAHEGSTLSDGTYRNALNNPGSYQNHHLVYNQAGSDCPTCSTGQVKRIVQAQRSTFYCPKCQKR